MFKSISAPGGAALQGLHLLQDLLSVEVPLTLNEAFCEHHRRRCPPSDELERECGRVRRIALHSSRARW